MDRAEIAAWLAYAAKWRLSAVADHNRVLLWNARDAVNTARKLRLDAAACN